eukprot:scaffold1883_cov261-Pinguiococcus_pyrenoidosus.AAC.10
MSAKPPEAKWAALRPYLFQCGVVSVRQRQPQIVQRAPVRVMVPVREVEPQRRHPRVDQLGNHARRPRRRAHGARHLGEAPLLHGQLTGRSGRCGRGERLPPRSPIRTARLRESRNHPQNSAQALARLHRVTPSPSALRRARFGGTGPARANLPYF